MKYKSICLLLALTLSVFAGIMTQPVSAQPQGPRMPKYVLKYYASAAATFTALQGGDIDFMWWSLTAAQRVAAMADDKLGVMSIDDLGLFAWSINNVASVNVTLGGITYNGIRNPFNDVNFRRAIFHLSDKQTYTAVIQGGLAVPLPTHIPKITSSWWNTSLVGYSYSSVLAAQKLDLAGFTDTDGDGIRNYPVGWPGRPTGPNLDPIIFYVRNDHLPRFEAGNNLIGLLNTLPGGKVPVNAQFGPTPFVVGPVMTNKQYHLYSAGWSLGKFPLYLRSWSHSNLWVLGVQSPNYHTGPVGGAPILTPAQIAAETLKRQELNDAGDALWAAATFPIAQACANQLQSLLTDKYAVFVPLWSTKSFFAYRKFMGVTNMQGVGPENYATYLGAHKIAGYPYADTTPIDTIVGGTISAPSLINQIYSGWVWDTQTFAYMAGLMSVRPYDIYLDQPWLAQDWNDTQTWIDPDDGKTKTKVTWFLRKDASWIKPGTGAGSGDPLAPFTTAGFEFNAWYYFQTPDSYIWSTYQDVKNVEVVDDYTVNIYYNVTSVFARYYGYGRALYAPAWKTSPLATLNTIVANSQADLNALPFRAVGAPVEIVSVSTGTADIISGRIRASAFPVTIQYWARGTASGYTPGGLPIDAIHVGTGYWYMTSHVAGVGGATSYKANVNFFLETPPLGEIDYIWTYVGDAPQSSADPPRSGYYIVDIFDVTFGTSRYQSIWKLVPNSAIWEPAADWQPSEDRFHVGIADIVEITNDYNTQFGTPPP